MKPKIYKDEHAAQQELIEQLEMHNCWVRKLHGSMLQPGLPDLMVATPRSFLFVAENKFWRLSRKPSLTDFVGLLRNTQRITIVANLWARKVYAPIYAFTASSIVHMTDGTNIFETTIEQLATYTKELSCNPLAN